MTADPARATGSRPASAPAVAPELRCEIRPLDTTAELIESYRLRFEVYGALGYLRCANAAGLEIDEYDMSSIPFGAFDTASGAMIGTLRLITTEPQPDYEPLVRGLVDDLGDLDLIEQAFTQPPHPLPSIISDEIGRQIEAFNTERFTVRELSRTIVRPGHRGSGVSRGLMELGLAYASRFAPAVLVGACLPQHVPMYARYGYVPLPRTGLDRFDSVGQVASPVVCRTDVLPQPTRAHIDELLRSMGLGATELMLEIGHDSLGLVRFEPPRRARRSTRDW